MSKIKPIYINPLTDGELLHHLSNGRSIVRELVTNSIFEASFNVNVLVEEKQRDYICVGWSRLVLPEGCYLLVDGHKVANPTTVYANLALSSRYSILCPFGTERVKVSFEPLFIKRNCYRFASKYFLMDDCNVYYNGLMCSKKPWIVSKLPSVLPITRSVCWKTCGKEVCYYRVLCNNTQVAETIELIQSEIPELEAPIRVSINVAKTVLVYNCNKLEQRFTECAKQNGINIEFIAKTTEPNEQRYREQINKANLAIINEFKEICAIFDRQ